MTVVGDSFLGPAPRHAETGGAGYGGSHVMTVVESSFLGPAPRHAEPGGAGYGRSYVISVARGMAGRR